MLERPRHQSAAAEEKVFAYFDSKRSRDGFFVTVKSKKLSAIFKTPACCCWNRLKLSVFWVGRCTLSCKPFFYVIRLLKG
jgi:hypothetical protein